MFCGSKRWGALGGCAASHTEGGTSTQFLDRLSPRHCGWHSPTQAWVGRLSAMVLKSSAYCNWKWSQARGRLSLVPLASSPSFSLQFYVAWDNSASSPKLAFSLCLHLRKQYMYYSNSLRCSTQSSQGQHFIISFVLCNCFFLQFCNPKL